MDMTRLPPRVAVTNPDDAGGLPAALFASRGAPPSLALRAWTGMVGTGSSLAVKICRRI